MEAAAKIPNFFMGNTPPFANNYTIFSTLKFEFSKILSHEKR
ncbi:hypothetical protein JMA_05750 [Jeotgalibacillus malaysiensis]|uniref:Uncharacterized protein n=1 Tax=Jeotgalibacillus malaysiensis TaxID=1508404 RepID=A0A0B5AML0_9BACL|nr:hypothetical protein JMA_05750 [Jeotgalibacillus malaysiensis]